MVKKSLSVGEKKIVPIPGKGEGEGKESCKVHYYAVGE